MHGSNQMVAEWIRELLITDKVELKQPDEVDNEYKRQITTLKTKLDTNTDQYKKL